MGDGVSAEVDGRVYDGARGIGDGRNRTAVELHLRGRSRMGPREKAEDVCRSRRVRPPVPP